MFKNKEIKIFRSKNSEIKDFDERKNLKTTDNDDDSFEDEDGFKELKCKKKFIKVRDQIDDNSIHTTSNSIIDTIPDVNSTQDPQSSLENDEDSLNYDNLNEDDEECEDVEWIGEDNINLSKNVIGDSRIENINQNKSSENLNTNDENKNKNLNIRKV